MCIRNNESALLKEKNKKTPFVLWKVVRVNGAIGMWRGTYSQDKFVVGLNTAERYTRCGFHSEMIVKGRFHCFLTRKNARDYRINYSHKLCKFKIIKVHANRQDIIDVGLDENCALRAISVSKMTIKSLKHQR